MRLAYILPRYGSEVLGGAETLARAVIQRLVHNGHQIEVWTTCARSTYTWVNEYPAGVEEIDGATVRRFPVEAGRPYELLAEPLSRENQYRWVDHLAHSPELYRHITAQGLAFDFLIFMPYIVGTTFYGARIYPQKSVIWACLHDELPAYLAPTRDLLTSAAGIIFNSSAEQELMVKRLRIEHPHTVVAGMGFDHSAGDVTAFRRKYPHIAEQFFVYAGRLESSKNVDLLFRYFGKYQSQRTCPLNLVLLGHGPLYRNNHSRNGIISLGFVDEATKRDILAAAAFLCQPSLYESFSIVLMEAWLQGRPVLVHEHCSVTAAHVRQAQGGLYFTGYNDFEGALDYLLTHPSQAQAMGANGRAYVEQHYNWPMILDRLEQALLSWLEQAQ